ncbi:hypothetical protein SDC9_04063 [bioreactor metagenome]|uniref:DUF340 domain-containing protein n=1 Tax=bioreactor metagenome TaxID=1076179 RepID=A0A644SV16_9ZZZZ|nr:hypothetical protein [Negativicutes bacterium]
MKWTETVLVFIVTGIITVIGNTIGYHHPLSEAAIGYLMLLAVVLLGMAISKYVPLKLPMVFWISLLALLSTSAISPWAKTISYYTGKLDFTAICTPILAYAGLAAGKDLAMFKQMSWRIVVVALAVYTGTFVLATVVAQVMLRIEGLI